MPRTVDHIVETHRIARERRANRQPIWKHTVNLADVFHNDELTFERSRDRIVGILRGHRWAKDNHLLVDLLEELADTTTVDEFNEVWDVIYDEADYDRVWIRTI